MPSKPQHDWYRYLRFVSLLLVSHAVAYFAFGGVSPGWAILSAGAFGLALGVPIGRAEYYTDGYDVKKQTKKHERKIKAFLEFFSTTLTDTKLWS